MKISSIIKLAILFAVFYYVIVFINANRDMTDVRFPWFGGDVAVSSPKLSRSMKQVEEKYYYGIEALSKGDHQSASVFFEEILTIDPDNFRTLVKFGELLRETGKHQRAISIHLQALSLSQNNIKVLKELASDYRAAGDTAKAKEMLERIIEISPKGNNAIYRQLRDMLIEEQDWERSLEIHRKLIPLVTHNGRREEEKALLSGLEYEVAIKRMTEGQIDAAVRMFRAILEREPFFLPAVLSLGDALQEKGEEDAAVKTWLESYYQIKQPMLLARLEDFYLERDDPDKAIEIYNTVIAKDQEDLLPKLLLGKLFYHLAIVDRAIAIFEEIDSEFEYAPVMFYFMAKIRARKGEHEAAIDTLRNLIRSSGLLQAEFICSSCCTTYSKYQPRCERCGRWNTIQLNIKKGQSLDEMEVASRPMYA